jgi:hypothetical protein
MLHLSVPVKVIQKLGLKEKQRVAVRIAREMTDGVEKYVIRVEP